MRCSHNKNHIPVTTKLISMIPTMPAIYRMTLIYIYCESKRIKEKKSIFIWHIAYTYLLYNNTLYIYRVSLHVSLLIFFLLLLPISSFVSFFFEKKMLSFLLSEISYHIMRSFCNIILITCDFFCLFVFRLKFRREL